jgi:outer membrane protein assembly factor BamB
MLGGGSRTVIIQIGLLLIASVLIPFQAPATGCGVVGPRDPGDSPWPTFHGDNARTGNTTEPGPGTNRMLWSNGTGQNCYSSPSVAGGKVFIGSLDGAIYCFNAVTGVRLWRTVTVDQVQSSPAVDMAADRLYIGSMDDYLYCLNATSGAQLWRSQAGGDLTSSPLLYDGKVYIGCGDWYNGPADGYLYCFDASTGARLWRTADAGGAASPALADGRLFTMSDNNLHCLDPQTGDYLWNASVGTTYYGSPAVAEGSVYCSAGNGHIYCFNASGGTKTWEVNSGFPESQCTPAVSNGSVYACFDGGGVTPSAMKKYQASDGTLVWTRNTQGNAWGAPTVTGGRVYFSNDRTIECLNISDGSQLWSYTGADGDIYGIGGCAALWAGRLYIGGSEAKLYCFGVAEPNRPPSAVVLNAPNTIRETSLCLTWNTSNEPDFARYEVHRSPVP